ncbi:MAG TPA: hypothetical protein VI861_02325, partial [Rickettsiales bacterium]|nr:hypothetical protein [Rickettsiales bacterium]
DDMQIAKTLGFYEIKDFLAKKITKKEAVEIASQKTRNYAKRQLTWFRNQFKNMEVFSQSEDALRFLNKQNYEI